MEIVISLSLHIHEQVNMFQRAADTSCPLFIVF